MNGCKLKKIVWRKIIRGNGCSLLGTSGTLDPPGGRINIVADGI
jgi:hypothetical protein